MSDCGEIVSQPLFVLNELATLLFQLVELSVLPRERLPPRSELSKCFFHRRFEFVGRNKHAQAIVREVEEPDRLFDPALHCHRDDTLFVSSERHRDAVRIGAKLDMRRIGSGEAPAGKPRMFDQQPVLAGARRLQPIGRDLASEPGEPHHPLSDGRF